MSRPMAEVTCPQCQTRQEIDPDADGLPVHRVRRYVELRPVHRLRRAVPHAAGHAGVDLPELRHAAREEPPRDLACGHPAAAPSWAAIAALGPVVFLGAIARGRRRRARRTPSSPSSASPIADPPTRSAGISVDVQVLRVDALGERSTR